MAKSIYLTADSKSAKRKSINVADKISDATKDISSATKELNNVDYVDVSYEINQLQAMYKSSASQVNEFESFATTLENMVNDYISTDKECATRIKTNGKNHRENTGLKKNLALATVCASFDKIGDKIDNIADNVKDWAEDVANSIINSFKEDWDSYLQFVEGGISLFASIGVLIGGIAAAATGAGLPIAIPLLLSSLITMYTSIDKIASSILDISNVFETNGSTVTKESVDNKLFSFVYDALDIIAGVGTGAGLGKLADFTQATELFLLLGKGDFAAKGLEFIQNAQKVSDIGDYIGELQGLNEMWKSFRDGDISGGLLKYIGNKLFDKVFGEDIENKIGDVYGDFAESMIKNNNVVGVLG